jgi:uncharacterized membrane protein
MLMTVLILGLAIFLGAHSVRIIAEDWRTRQIERLGPNGWKGVYSIVSLLGFVLIVWGYGITRIEPVDIWMPALWTRHVAALLTLPAFILLAAAHVPGNRIKATLHHPMILGVKVWALAHLISNGRAADVVLFGAFLAWAVFDFRAARQRDRRNAIDHPAGTLAGDVITVAAGLGAWVVFALYLHAWLIGVRPFG